MKLRLVLITKSEMKGALHDLFAQNLLRRCTPSLSARSDIEQSRMRLAPFHYRILCTVCFPYALLTRPEGMAGSDEDWERAEQGLRDAIYGHRLRGQRGRRCVLTVQRLTSIWTDTAVLGQCGSFSLTSAASQLPACSTLTGTAPRSTHYDSPLLWFLS